MCVCVLRSSSDGARLLHLPAPDSCQLADVRLPVQSGDGADRLRVGADAVVGRRPAGTDRPTHALRLRRRPPASRRRRRLVVVVVGGGRGGDRRRRRVDAHLPGVRRAPRARVDGPVAAGWSQRDGLRRRRSTLGRLRVRRQQGRRRSGTS